MIRGSKVTRRAREALRPLLPRPYRHKRIRTHQERVRERAGVPELNRSFVDRFGRTVLRGPVQGVEYPAEWLETVDALVAKLVGAYESALHAALADQIRRKPPLFVDIGAAEGLYAVGFALGSTTTQVYAFEQDRQTRRRCREMIELNGVQEQVNLLGECSSRALSRLPALDNAFVLSDCEGAEHQIFSGELVDLLRQATVLIELHSDHPTQSDIDELLDRFSVSHRVSRIALTQADPDAFEELQALSEAQRELAVTEFRVDAHGWVLCEPRNE